MSDAVRNVVVRLSIEPGTVTMPDFSPFKTAREDVSRIITDMKTMGETLREVAATEQTLGQAARESAKAEKEKVNAHRTVEKSAKESADVQISESKRASEEMKRQATETANAIQSTFSNRRPLSEPGSGTSSSGSNRRPLTEPSNSISIGGDQATVIPPVDFSAVANVDESSARIDKHMAEFKAKREKESVDRIREEEETQRQVAELEQLWGQMVWKSQMALNQQRVKEEQKTADELMRTNSALNQQRLKEDQSTADSLEKTRSALNQQRIKEEQSTADALEKTRNSLNQQRIKEDQSTADSLEKTRNALNQQRLKEEQSTSDALTKTRNALNQQRLKEEQATEDALQKTRSALNQQRIREEEATATAIARTRDALNQQRMREDTQAAEAAQRAGEQLPRTFQQIQSGILGSVASSGRLAINIAMLSASGKKDTEELAKSFVSLQAKIGIVTETKQLFTGMSQTLAGLRQAGQLTQTLVAQQTALGIATTFSQAATLRLAGAAAVAQAAMGPIAIIAVAITAALTAASMIEEQYAESAEDIARRKEDQLKRYDDLHKTILKQMENEKIVMSEQTDQLNMQWEIKRLLLGDSKMSVADQGKEVEERRQAAQSQSEQNFKLKVKELQNSPERAEREKVLGVSIFEATQKRDEAKKNKESADTSFYAATEYGKFDRLKKAKELAAAQDELNKLEHEQKTIAFNQGDKQYEQLLKTEFVDGKVKDEDKLRETMKSLPIEQQRQMESVIKTIQDGYKAQLAVEAQSLPRMQRDLATAKTQLPQLERNLIQNGTFGEDENVARRYETQQGQSAKKQALRQLDQFDKIQGTSPQDLQRKEQITKEIEKTLSQDGVGLLTEDIKALLSKGAATDTSATTGVREKIADASTIDADEAKAAKENYDKLLKLRDEAKDATANLPALIEDIRAQINEIKSATDSQRRKNAADNLF